VLLALVTLYATLRHDFAPLPSLAGTLAVCGHPVVVAQSFFGRFYGPLLLFSACLVFLLRDGQFESWRRRSLLAAASVALCTIHYFGIIVWLLAVTARLAFSRMQGIADRGLAYVLAGPVALALCIPLYLGQKSALSASTWIPDPGLNEIWRLLEAYWAWLPVSALLLLGAFRLLFDSEAHRISEPEKRREAWPPLVALAVFPVVLIAISIFLQPVTTQRYAIPAVLALAPAVALVVSREPRWMRVVVLILLALVGSREVKKEGLRQKAYVSSFRSLSETLRDSIPPGASVVIAERHVLYPLADRTDSQDIHLVFPDIPASQMEGGFRDPQQRARLQRLLMHEQDVARVHAALFGFPDIISIADASKPDTVFFVGPRVTDLDPDAYVAGFFPEHDVQWMGSTVGRLVRRNGENLE
jgi:hypothetical protein